MNDTEQKDIVAFLATSAAHGAAEPVEHVETHISHVFLAGDRAYKMKKAVTFAYLDYSSLDRRHRFCEIEVALNRRTAPDIYLRTVPVTRAADGTLALNGDGEPVEWLVEMRRFNQDTLLDAVARRGELTRELIETAAMETARFHRDAEPSHVHGGAKGMAHVIDGMSHELAEAPAKLIDPRAARQWSSRGHAALDSLAGVLDRRKADGKVRRCHGDLHLKNICLNDGRPVLFDAIEFSEDIGTIDILYDLAFLLMDLEHRDLRELSNAALNAYLERMPEEIAGLEVLPLFLSCRAAVRAHVTAAASIDPARKSSGEAQNYLDAALAYLSPRQPWLVCVGGLSGSGKTTAARQLAPDIGAAPGAVVVRSDTIRKRLSGVDPTTRLGEDAYTPEASRRVYDALYAAAETAVRAGHSIILDAVFARPEERSAPQEIATSVGVRFAGFWLDADPATMERRVGGRSGDASDAGPEVLRHQLEYELGEISWRTIDADGSPDDTVRRLRQEYLSISK